MRLIDSNCLNMANLVMRKYEADFVTPSFCGSNFADEETFNSLSELFSVYAGFEPTFAPNVVVSAQGMLQKVLTLQGYRKEGVLFVMWGGYSHKDHWFEVPKGDYEVDVFDNMSVAVIGGFAVKLVSEPDNTDKEFTKADKLSSLEVGAFKIDSVKSVATKFGDKYIAIIGGKEYWANKQLAEYVNMLGSTDKLSGMTLNVISKGITTSGHPSVKVGLSK